MTYHSDVSQWKQMRQQEGVILTKIYLFKLKLKFMFELGRKNIFKSKNLFIFELKLKLTFE